MFFGGKGAVIVVKTKENHFLQAGERASKANILEETYLYYNIALDGKYQESEYIS